MSVPSLIYISILSDDVIKKMNYIRSISSFFVSCLSSVTVVLLLASTYTNANDAAKHRGKKKKPTIDRHHIAKHVMIDVRFVSPFNFLPQGIISCMEYSYHYILGFFCFVLVELKKHDD